VNAVKFGETLTDNADGNPELSFKHVFPTVSGGQSMAIRTQKTKVAEYIVGTITIYMVEFKRN